MRLASPHLYVNVHQTIWVLLAVGVTTAYITDFMGFREAVNGTLVQMARKEY